MAQSYPGILHQSFHDFRRRAGTIIGMTSQADFESAAVRVKAAPAQPPDRLLKLYGLYKQATVGDVAGDRPGMMDFKSRAKYNAWAALRGMAQDEARATYVKLVDEILAGAGA